MPPVSSFISLSRDNLIQFIRSEDFFSANPDLQPLAEQVAECTKNTQEAAAKKSCNCGGSDTRAMLPCVEAVLSALDAAKTTNLDTVETFVRYVTKKPTGADRLTNVTIYYMKPGEKQPQKYEFIA